jgi:hypothetical protein
MSVPCKFERSLLSHVEYETVRLTPTRSRRTPFGRIEAYDATGNGKRESHDVGGAAHAFGRFAVPHSNQSLLGAVSVCGKRNFEARDKGAEMAVGIHLAARRDHAPARKPANSGLFAKSREISVRRRLRGGAGRTRTRRQARSRVEPVSKRPLLRSNVA